MIQHSASMTEIAGTGKLDQLFDALPAAIFMVDESGNILSVSRRFDDYFGLHPSDLVGKPLNQFVEQLSRCFTEFMSYHEVIGYPLHDQENEFLRDVEVSLPKRRYLQVTSSPVRDADKFIGRIWLMRDITAEKEITDLKIQYGGARGAEELKSKFLTVVSHQLRTPLNSIRWNTELLLSGGDKGLAPEANDTLTEIYKAIANSISIVDDMILAVDIETRAVRFEKTETDLADVVNKAIHNVSRNAALKEIVIALNDLPPNLPKMFLDHEKVVGVLVRLLENAIRYSPRGGKVDVGIRAGKKDVVITIRDYGIGVAEADKPKLFQMFYRSQRALKEFPNASGLGLYISKYIVDAHDGTISFESEEGQGAAFTVSFPRKTAPAG